MRNIQRILELWGAWANNDVSGTDYSHIAAGFKGLLPQSKGQEQCCDDDGIIIDSCVARLKEYSKDEYQLLMDYYQRGKSLRKIAKARRCCDGTIRKELQHAQGFINGLLYALNIRLQCEISL